MPPRIRISGGSLQGQTLTSPRGGRTRPTTGRVREAIFNILRGSFESGPVLDLFAGTGALGIEAVSRGATEAVFVEASSGATKAIADSIERCGISERCSIVRGRLPAALEQIKGRFLTVFLDPPYEGDAGRQTLDRCSPLIGQDGILVYEHRSSYNPPEQAMGLELIDSRTYGDTGVALYQPQEQK